MALKQVRANNNFLEPLITLINKKFLKPEATLLTQFAHRCYESIAPEDLKLRTTENFSDLLVAHWNFVKTRKADEMKVRVYNPKLETHGWQSAYTIIEILCEDMSFLVDSIQSELNRRGLNINLLIHVSSVRISRDKDGLIQSFLTGKNNQGFDETSLYIEVTRVGELSVLEEIQQSIITCLRSIKVVVNDWSQMRDEVFSCIKALKNNNFIVNQPELEESIHFLQWLVEDHFTFLGVTHYHFSENNEECVIQNISEKSFGLIKHVFPGRDRLVLKERNVTQRELLHSKRVITIGKCREKSIVHRPSYMDSILVKFYDKNDNLNKIIHFIGLYTSEAYNNSITSIPLLRKKIQSLLSETGFGEKTHERKVLLNIIENLPRDDVFQAPNQELLDLVLGIFYLQERQKTKLFLRKDIFGRFFSCLVFLPRESFTSDLRLKIQNILMKELQGEECSFVTKISESVLARIHFEIRINPNKSIDVDLEGIERQIIFVSRNWKDHVLETLVSYFQEENGIKLFKKYKNAFPIGYQETFFNEFPIADIESLESLSEKNPLAMNVYRNASDSSDTVCFKLFCYKKMITLSDVVPILENMGLKIINEKPYIISLKDGNAVYMSDYQMLQAEGLPFNLNEINILFQECFYKVWHTELENDGFNQLIFSVKMNSRQITLLRSYAKYLWQIGFSFSQSTIENTMRLHPEIALDLVILFEIRFDPDCIEREQKLKSQYLKIENSLESVKNLNEDRILRKYLYLILATIRTNFYQKDKNGNIKQYVSFKFDSSKIPDLPLPKPLYEIFVYSPRMEGIHLRAAKVARGGIRWSDRHDDFRTEILGLMKAQQVKNAVIVPLGAKGGFVIKKSFAMHETQKMLEEAIACYQILIKGLLDITDNLDGEQVIPPNNVVRYDAADPYLVVAADKGTATFSDIANNLSQEYQFWLGDAFASGGSAGYDHKKMGITARGAWECVKQHCQDIGLDPGVTDFTVIGIGDMSGDVFGNGLLMSEHMKLVAAFNHMHIFLDPNPDAKTSFMERQRLFHLPRSSWSDYNINNLSKGGGIFLRSEKFITLSPEVRQCLNVEAENVTPNDLIQMILKAPVDLLWNGGIGTYVKSSCESNSTVGDRTNDLVRVNGKDLRCRIVAEGGNLGFTQLGRIEYAQNKGKINTDSIDNSAGVNCSDNEVNIKILLNEVVKNHQMNEEQRNKLLVEMTDEVALLTLRNNVQQSEAISFAVFQADKNLEMYVRVLRDLELSGAINREIEFLPSVEEVNSRKISGSGLTRPEISIMMAHIKNFLKQEILNSKIPEEPYVQLELENSFPKPLREKYQSVMGRHRLKREIIATRLSNNLVNDMGITFAHRLRDETGASFVDIIKSYIVSRDIFGFNKIKENIRDLNFSITAETKFKMLQEATRLIRRATRWFLRNTHLNMTLNELYKAFSPGVLEINRALSEALIGNGRDYMHALASELMEVSVPPELAYRIGSMVPMFSALDIVTASENNHLNIQQVASIYYAIGSRLDLDWLREQIKSHPIDNHWEALSRAMLRDDLDKQQANITIHILTANQFVQKDLEDIINNWLVDNSRIVDRWDKLIADFKSNASSNFTMFSVALHELHNLV